MTLLWWHWLALGLILVGLELAASGGFYVIFFGVAAIAIAGLRLLDVAGPVWVQFLLFSVLSVGSLLFFRSPLLRWLKLDTPGKDVDSLVGETAVAARGHRASRRRAGRAARHGVDGAQRDRPPAPPRAAVRRRPGRSAHDHSRT